MAVLEPGRPHVQRDPQLVVENRLAPGAWRFRLQVADEAGNLSAPTELVVTVARDGSVDPVRPNPIRPDPVRPDPVSPVRPVLTDRPAPTPAPAPTPRRPPRRTPTPTPAPRRRRDPDGGDR